MKNKNLVIFVSVIVGVAAAVAATFVLIKYLQKKRSKLASADYVFENDFEDLIEEA